MKNGTVHSTYLFHKKKRPGLNPASLALPGNTNKSSDSQEKSVIDSTGTMIFGYSTGYSQRSAKSETIPTKPMF